MGSFFFFLLSITYRFLFRLPLSFSHFSGFFPFFFDPSLSFWNICAVSQCIKLPASLTQN